MTTVSVIIPTFNRRDFVCEAIDSVLSQTYKNFEIIVVDDGSSDQTAQILKGYGDKIKYVYQQNKGIAVARNRGIQEAQGEYVAFLDSDDVWCQDKLQAQIDYIQDHPEVDMISGKAVVIDERGNPKGIFKPSKYSTPDFEGVLQSNHVITSTVLLKKNVFERVGLFDESLNSLEDFDFWLRVAVEGLKLAYINEPLIKYRYSEISETKNLSKIYASAPQVFRKISKLCTSEQRKIVRQKHKDSCYILSQEYKKQGRIVAFLKYYWVSKISWAI